MSSLPGIDLPPTTEYPINGFGGSFYDTPFYVPVYNPIDPYVSNQTTWRWIDTWAQMNMNIIIAQSTCFGLCLTTLIYLISLTPSHKRGTAFHVSLVLALVFEMIKLLSNVVQSTQPTASQFSAYIDLTQDDRSTIYTESFKLPIHLDQFTSCATFVCTMICLYIQSKGLLTPVKLRSNIIYKLILAYLLVASVVAFCFRLAFAIFRLATLSHDPTPYDLYTVDILRRGTLMSYSICILSWSMISFVSTMFIITTGRKSLLSGNKVFDSALNFIALVGLESFVCPIIFSILQIVPNEFAIFQPETVVVPSVLILLPLGPLFVSIRHGNGSGYTASKGSSQQALTARSPLDRTGFGQGGRAGKYSESYGEEVLVKVVRDPVERELEEIDTVDSIVHQGGKRCGW